MPYLFTMETLSTVPEIDPLGAILDLCALIIDIACNNIPLLPVVTPTKDAVDFGYMHEGEKLAILRAWL